MMNNIDSRIIYCDSNCIVVNKVAGEAVEGARTGIVDLPAQLAVILQAEKFSRPDFTEDKLPHA